MDGWMKRCHSERNVLLLYTDASSRIINRDDLAKWAGSPLATDKNFVSHSIFYDEDQKDRSATSNSPFLLCTLKEKIAPL